MQEKIEKLEELKQTRCAKCAESGNPDDMWCWSLPWLSCGVKSLREEIEREINDTVSAKKHIEELTRGNKKMREILFKAKTEGSGEWVEGSLVVICENDYRIVTEEDARWAYTSGCIYDGDMIPIDPETICQYTGLTDKNGNKVWENDILSISKSVDAVTGTYYFPEIVYPANVKVKWDLCAWMWETIGEKVYYIHFPDAWCHYKAEVIGNVFDNHELMKGE